MKHNKPRSRSPDHAPDEGKPPAAVPLKPRRTLFIVLSLVFALWVVLLIALYVFTVRR